MDSDPKPMNHFVSYVVDQILYDQEIKMMLYYLVIQYISIHILVKIQMTFA